MHNFILFFVFDIFNSIKYLFLDVFTDFYMFDLFLCIFYAFLGLFSIITILLISIYLVEEKQNHQS